MYLYQWFGPPRRVLVFSLQLVLFQSWIWQQQWSSISIRPCTFFGFDPLLNTTQSRCPKRRERKKNPASIGAGTKNSTDDRCRLQLLPSSSERAKTAINELPMEIIQSMAGHMQPAGDERKKGPVVQGPRNIDFLDVVHNLEYRCRFCKKDKKNTQGRRSQACNHQRER